MSETLLYPSDIHPNNPCTHNHITCPVLVHQFIHWINNHPAGATMYPTCFSNSPRLFIFSSFYCLQFCTYLCEARRLTDPAPWIHPGLQTPYHSPTKGLNVRNRFLKINKNVPDLHTSWCCGITWFKQCRITVGLFFGVHKFLFVLYDQPLGGHLFVCEFRVYCIRSFLLYAPEREVKMILIL